MALINNIYVFVESEDVGRDTDITQHPVEKGLPLTDTIKNNPKTLSISGKIVDTKKLKASDIKDKIDALRRKGSLINYKGRINFDSLQIKSFNTSQTNSNWGGYDFDMELVKVRIAQSAYNPKKQTKQNVKQKKVNKTNPVLKVGSRVVFKGGSVYVSSDAKKPAATRGRSTCKITIISTASWSVHDYHLISTDGKLVYGWVDKSNIEGTGNSGTSSVTNGGTQQVKKK